MMNNEETSKKHPMALLNKGQPFFPNLASLPDFMLKWIDQHSKNYVVVWGKDGKMRYISKSIKTLLGYKPSELLGKSWDDIFAPEDVSFIKSYFSNNTTLDIENKVFTISVRNKQGHYIWFEYLIGKIQEEGNNEEAYFICTFRDIPNQKEAQDRMIQSEKLSVAGQLAAGIAHEIRNPLTSLKGFLQLLQAGINQKEVYYKIMSEEIDKIEAITSELLFLSKPMTDKKKVESINSMIKDVLILLRSQANLNSISLNWEFDKEYFIYCDRSQFKQVLINVVKNAIEVTEANGKIDIETRKIDSYIEVDIIDEGPGIPEEIIHKVGEPFFTTKQGGTGLGLMITKQILDHHDAKIKILQNEDEGSTFRIIIPSYTKSS